MSEQDVSIASDANDPVLPIVPSVPVIPTVPTTPVVVIPTVPSLSPTVKSWVGQGCVLADRVRQLVADATFWRSGAEGLFSTFTDESLAKSIDLGTKVDFEMLVQIVDQFEQLAAANNGLAQTSMVKLARNVGNVR